MKPSIRIKNGNVIIYPIHDPTPPATVFDRLCRLLYRYVPVGMPEFTVYKDRYIWNNEKNELIRIFSARDAEPSEIEEYNDGVKSILG
jgi:hypothetical protein